MKLRGRLLLTSTLLVLTPLAVLAILIRHETGVRLAEQYERRVEALADGIESELRERDLAVGARLRAWKRALAEDNRLRVALAESPPAEGAWLLDVAGRSMELLGLDLLQIQASDGRIVSSGHYRNDFDRIDPETPARLALSPGAGVLIAARRPEGPFLALARVDSLRLGGATWRLVGGFEMGPERLSSLAPGKDLTVFIHYPGGIVTAAGDSIPGLDPDRILRAIADSPDERRLVTVGDRLVRSIAIPAAPAPRSAGEASLETARLLVVHSLAPMQRLLRGLDLQLAGAWLLVAAGTLAVAVQLSARISRPLERLAAQTAALDLDRLDARFTAGGDDEVGALSRFLDAMAGRLRASVGRLREAERRATRGEIARQVNHDLRNGITPLRNVLRHLADVAGESPGELPRVWNERHGTLEAGLAYLDGLAGNWRRLSTPPSRSACDLGDVVRQVAAGRLVADGGAIALGIPEPLPRVWADPVGLRRVVENLVANALESLDSDTGRVRITLEDRAGDEQAVLLIVEDDGTGIAAEDTPRVFDDFWTTKAAGSGLGLSIVRRLVSDFEGTVRLEPRADGRGTVARVAVPKAPAPEDSQ